MLGICLSVICSYCCIESNEHYHHAIHHIAARRLKFLYANAIGENIT